MSHNSQPVAGAQGSTRKLMGSGTISTSAAPSISFMPRQPDDFKLLLFDGSTQANCRYALLAGPKPVTLDKTQRVTPSTEAEPETPSLGRRKMADLVGDLCRNRCGPWRAAAPLHIDLHPEGFPSPRGADAVHGGGTLDAPRMRGIEEHERFCAGSDFLDLLPQQAAILNDRLVGLAEMFAGAILDRTHRFDHPLVVYVDVGAHAGVGRGGLLVRIETVIVRLVLARTVIGQLIQFEALVAHLVLVDRRRIRGEDRVPVAVLVIDRHVPLRDRHLGAHRDDESMRE